MLTVGQITILSMTSFEYNSISFISLKRPPEIVFDGLKALGHHSRQEAAGFGGRIEVRTIANGSVKI